MPKKCCYSPQQVKKLTQTVDFLKIIAEENRVRILCLLKHGPKCVCEIWPALGLSQNLASHHLGILKEAGLIKSRRQGLKIFYSLKGEKIKQKLNNLKSFLIF